MSELKPCPFCKSEAELLTFWDFYKFSCKNADCTAHVADAPYVQHAEGVWYGTIDEARAAWNTRAVETCSVVASYSPSDINEEAEWYFAFSCGCELYWDEPEPPSFCPDCGAKVVGE